jgi:hypothetical protein
MQCDENRLDKGGNRVLAAHTPNLPYCSHTR